MPQKRQKEQGKKQSERFHDYSCERAKLLWLQCHDIFYKAIPDKVKGRNTVVLRPVDISVRLLVRSCLHITGWRCVCYPATDTRSAFIVFARSWCRSFRGQLGVAGARHQEGLSPATGQVLAPRPRAEIQVYSMLFLNERGGSCIAFLRLVERTDLS